MKRPDCKSCAGAMCEQGRYCPEQAATDAYVLRALALYLFLFWVAVGCAIWTAMDCGGA